MEQQKAEIAAAIRKSFESCVGQKVTTDTITDATKAVAASLAGHVAKPEAIFVRAKTAWGWMGWQDRLRWFAFTRFPFRATGTAWRTAIQRENQLIAELDKLVESNPELELMARMPLEMPLFLHEKPKEIIISHVQVQMKEPLKYMNIEITV